MSSPPRTRQRVSPSQASSAPQLSLLDMSADTLDSIAAHLPPGAQRSFREACVAGRDAVTRQCVDAVTVYLRHRLALLERIFDVFASVHALAPSPAVMWSAFRLQVGNNLLSVVNASQWPNTWFVQGADGGYRAVALRDAATFAMAMMRDLPAWQHIDLSVYLVCSPGAMSFNQTMIELRQDGVAVLYPYNGNAASVRVRPATDLVAELRRLQPDLADAAAEAAAPRLRAVVELANLVRQLRATFPHRSALRLADARGGIANIVRILFPREDAAFRAAVEASPRLEVPAGQVGF